MRLIPSFYESYNQSTEPAPTVDASCQTWVDMVGDEQQDSDREPVPLTGSADYPCEKRQIILKMLQTLVFILCLTLAFGADMTLRGWPVEQCQGPYGEEILSQSSTCALVTINNCDLYYILSCTGLTFSGKVCGIPGCLLGCQPVQGTSGDCIAQTNTQLAAIKSYQV